MSLKNQTLLEHINRQSTSFVSSRLNPSRIMCYWGLLLRQYSIYLYTASHLSDTNSVYMAVDWSPPDTPSAKPTTRRNTTSTQNGKHLAKKTRNRGVCVCVCVCVCLCSRAFILGLGLGLGLGVGPGSMSLSLSVVCLILVGVTRQIVQAKRCESASVDVWKLQRGDVGKRLCGRIFW